MAKKATSISLKTGENTWETYELGGSGNIEELSINISNVSSNGWQDNSANSLYYQAFNNIAYLKDLKNLLQNAKQVSAFIRVDWDGAVGGYFEIPTYLETTQSGPNSYVYPYFKWRASATSDSYFAIGNVPGIGSAGVFFTYTATNKNVLFNRLDDWEMYDGIELVVRVMK